MKNVFLGISRFFLGVFLCSMVSTACAGPMWSGMLIVDRTSSIHSEAAREKPALSWPVAIHVDEGSNAYKEGLRSGDYIMGTADKEILMASELETVLEKPVPLKIQNSTGMKVVSYSPSPANEDVMAYLRIRSFLRLGKVKENVDAIKKVISEHSQSPIVNFMGAFAFGAIKDRDQANYYLQEVVKGTPDQLLARICLKRLPKDLQTKMEEELKTHPPVPASDPDKTAQIPGKSGPAGEVPAGFGSDTVGLDEPIMADMGNAVSMGEFQNASLDRKIEIIREQVSKNPNAKGMKSVLCSFLLQKVKVEAKLSIEELEPYLREAVDLGVDPFKPQFVWGNMLFQKKSFEAAVPHLEDASRANPEHLDCTMKVAISLLKCLKYDEAIPHFERARKKVPNDFYVLYYLGLTHFEMKDFDKAIETWEEALKNAPTPNDARQIQMLIQKAREQDAATGGGTKDENQRFVIHYFGDSQKDIGDMTLEILEEIYDQVTGDFNYKPDIKINVIFFRTEDFAKVNNAPQWAGALARGEKILVPLRQGYSDINTIKGILAHEFTHVIINLRTNQRCPTWIHEGLAQNQEFKAAYGDAGTMRPDMERCFREEVQEKKRLIPLMQIQLNAGTYQADVNLGYVESYMAMRYFIEKWNWSGVDEMLSLINQGSHLENAIEQVSGRPISQFQNEFFEWVMGVQ